MTRIVLALVALVVWSCTLGGSTGGVAATSSLPLVDSDEWLTWALAKQIELQAARPLDQAQLPSSHNSFNSRRSGYFNDTDFVATGQTLYSQTLTLEQQLDLGVRRVDLEVHWVYDKLHVCVGGGEGLVAMCNRMATSGIPGGCASMGIEDVGDHTGCRRTDQTLSQVTAMLSAWSARNPQELVVVEVRDATEGREVQVASALAEAFGATAVFSRADKAAMPSGQWPTLADLRAAKKRAVIFSTVPDATHMLDVVAFPSIDNSLAKLFTGVPSCGYTNGAAVVSAQGKPYAEFIESRQFINLCQMMADSPDSSKRAMSPMVCGVNFEPEYEQSGAEQVGIFSDAMLAQLAECELVGGLDLITGRQLRKLVWSWAVGTGFSTSDKGAVMVATQGGRWVQAEMDTTRSVACRSVDRSRPTTDLWSIDASSEATFEAAAFICPDGYEFRAPDGAGDNQLLLLSLRRAGAPAVWVGTSTRAGEASAAGRGAVAAVAALVVPMVVAALLALL